nr:MAG TPA: hypothetical protein [Caudoviricetes sp.]
MQKYSLFFNGKNVNFGLQYLNFERRKLVKTFNFKS